MKSEISTSIFCFSISSEILSTYLYFLKLISSSYSLPSIVVFTHGRNWEVRLGRSFLRHHKTPHLLYHTKFHRLSLHTYLSRSNRRTQSRPLFQIPNGIRLFLQRYQNILSVRIIFFPIFPTKNSQAFFKTLPSH